MVIVVLADEPAGVSVEDEKLQFIIWGKSLQLRMTGWLKPLTGEMTTWPGELPATRLAGVTVKVKSGLSGAGAAWLTVSDTAFDVLAA